MTIEKANALKQGDQLFWVKRPSDKTRYKINLNGKILSIGAYPEEMYAKSQGNPVTFVRFKETGLGCHNYDMYGLPIIYVKTKTGIKSFSSGHFE
jgi:hypothetical protein